MLFVSDQGSASADNFRAEADGAPLAHGEGAKLTDYSSNVQFATRPQVCIRRLDTTKFRY